LIAERSGRVVIEIDHALPSGLLRHPPWRLHRAFWKGSS
jgi:hypothetical protein